MHCHARQVDSFMVETVPEKKIYGNNKGLDLAKMSDAEQQPMAEPLLQGISSPDSESKDANIFKENSSGLSESIDNPSIDQDKDYDQIASPDQETQDNEYDQIASPDQDPEENDEGQIASPDPQGNDEGQIASPDPQENDDQIASPDPQENDNQIASPDKEPEESEDGQIASPAKEPPGKGFENELDFEDEAYSAAGKTKSSRAKEKEKSSDTEEEGSCTSEKKSKNKEEEPKDDGECSDGGEEELEEGELNDDNGREDSSKANSTAKQTCRFYSRGQCFFGQNCRFAHVNVASGNYYSMFAPSTPTTRVPYSDYFDPSHGIMSQRSGPLPLRPDFVAPLPVCSPSIPAEESAWERGLQTAKELVRKANKRKIEDADFSEKSLNLSLIVNEKNVPEYIDSDSSYKKKRRDVPYPKYDDQHEVYDEYDTRNHYRPGFENYDARYHREHRRGDHGRDRMERDPHDKYRPKSPRSKDKYRDDRMQEVQPRSRDYSRDANDYFDPWRRSKSPKGAARRSRSRSGSYSSVSSYSWSDRSFSSNTYSRSSRSSSRSPRSRQKRKPSPTITNPPFASDKPDPLPPNTFTTIKKKPEGRGGISSSRSRTPSISRSRSFSRSISMSSVSSASSRDSLSSIGSPSRRQNAASILRKDENPPIPVGKSNDPPKVPGSVPAAIPLSTSYLSFPLEKEDITIKSPIINDYERDPLEEQFLAPENDPFPSLQHLLPTIDRKEPMKTAPHKQQIKLTLLNKNPPTKTAILPKKELDINRKSGDDPSRSAGPYFSGKGPHSPPPIPVAARPPPVLVPKKSASSRRDELLKQLKAVEDAIARKRAKFG
ncbi:hypothetical protein JTE90_022520 [Oedothorax gibbosus]|uniref:C3H1-type domain-containing protein n=1 Tax=Oedothorax gibbosus TaxID=931172 RepID=A0AAV6V1F7_9ARAC|nr:hypothetical protein JTE90_022520 [Oedothorax gibbosus]